MEGFKRRLVLIPKRKGKRLRWILHCVQNDRGERHGFFVMLRMTDDL